MTQAIDLKRLVHLAELFKHFHSGKHLNRLSDAALWAELQQEQTAYRALFQALGYELCIDGRGFAWFHTDEKSTSLSQQSRQFALLFMVIFDTQADAGKSLNRFSDWAIDRTLFTTASEHHQELLQAEGLDVDALLGLMQRAETFGFTRREAGNWQLLPAVCRYLDHFEALAEQLTDETTVPDVDEPDEDTP